MRYRLWICALAGVLFLTGSASVPVATATPTQPSIHSIALLGHELFRALRADDRATQRRLFFPEGAYIAMKSGRIPNPAADFLQRLLAFYQLDATSYYQLLHSGPPATFLRTTIDPSATNWIPAGVCENSIGYWYTPRIRIVYTQGGVVKSFGVDSLISWSGRYYIIHLGPNPRPVNVGTVLQPSHGPGTPGPGGGC